MVFYLVSQFSPIFYVVCQIGPENLILGTLDVLYLDFSKAFDRVPKRRLLVKLQHLAISGKLWRCIDFFLSNRTFRVKVGSSFSRPVEVLSGVPQGSVLGSLLFVTYTADLKNTIKSQFAMYADDIKLYNNSSNAVLLKEDLLAVYKWSTDWLLPLNIEINVKFFTLVRSTQSVHTILTVLN